MEELVTFLLHLAQKGSFHTEADREAEIDLVRAFARHVGLGDLVPPAPGATNAPLEVPDVDPGPVAEPVPAEEQTPIAATFAPRSAFEG
jgi:hypothetical protein